MANISDPDNLESVASRIRLINVSPINALQVYEEVKSKAHEMLGHYADWFHFRIAGEDSGVPASHIGIREGNADGDEEKNKNEVGEEESLTTSDDSDEDDAGELDVDNDDRFYAFTTVDQRELRYNRNYFTIRPILASNGVKRL